MKRLALATIFVAASASLSSGAFAASQCNIVGSWTDEYGVTATFTSETTGTATDTSLCAETYNIKVTKVTTKVFDSSASVPDKSCSPVKAKLKFAKGSCTSASGTVIVEGMKLSDVWTKSGGDAIVRHAPVADVSALISGLK